MKKVILIVLFVVSLLSSSISAYYLFFKEKEESGVSSEGMFSEIKEKVSSEGFLEGIFNVFKKNEYSDVLFEEVITEINEKANLWSSDAKLHHCYGVVAQEEGSIYTHEPGEYSGWICTYFSNTTESVQNFKYSKYDITVQETSSNGLDYENVLSQIEGTILRDGITLESILGSYSAYTIAVDAGMDVENNDYDMSLMNYRDYTELNGYYDELDDLFEEMSKKRELANNVYDNQVSELEGLKEELYKVYEEIEEGKELSEYTYSEAEEIYEKALRWEELYKEIYEEDSSFDFELSELEEEIDNFYDEDASEKKINNVFAWQITERSKFGIEEDFSTQEINIYIINAYTGELYKIIPGEASS